MCDINFLGYQGILTVYIQPVSRIPIKPDIGMANNILDRLIIDCSSVSKTTPTTSSVYPSKARNSHHVSNSRGPTTLFALVRTHLLQFVLPADCGSLFRWMGKLSKQLKVAILIVNLLVCRSKSGMNSEIMVLSLLLWSLDGWIP